MPSPCTNSQILFFVILTSIIFVLVWWYILHPIMAGSNLGQSAKNTSWQRNMDSSTGCGDEPKQRAAKTRGMTQRALKRPKRQTSKPKLTKFCYEGRTCNIKFDVCEVLDCILQLPAIDHIHNIQIVCKDTCLKGDRTRSIIINKILANTDGQYYSDGKTPKTDLHDRITLVKNTPTTYAASQAMVEHCKGRNTNTLRCNPLLLSIRNPKLSDSGIYSISFLCTILASVPCNRKITTEDYIQLTILKSNSPSSEDTISSLSEAIKFETGQDMNENTWLKWVQYTAHTMLKEDCIACSAARPTLATAPAPYVTKADQICMLKLFTQNTFDKTNECYHLHSKLPVVTSKDVPLHWTLSNAKYTCYLKDTIIHANTNIDPNNEIETFADNFCNQTLSSDNFEEFSLLTGHSVARADVWWLCTDFQLHAFLPTTWTGIRTPVMLIIPFTIGPAASLWNSDKPSLPIHSNFKFKHVQKRELLYPSKSKPLGSFNNDIYLSAIGTPVGVPNEFKAQDEIAAGFSSILFSWVTTNKNVVWLNYIYYNQQRFINHTIAALEGIVEQLGPTSLMAWQNRIALDMLLAEKLGVCSLFGSDCCTFLPNHTSPDGKIAVALNKLKALSAELAENSGVPENTWFAWLYRLFGPWAGTIVSIITTILIIIAVLAILGCCIIPCLRSLVERLIVTAMSRQSPPQILLLTDVQSANLQNDDDL